MVSGRDLLPRAQVDAEALPPGAVGVNNHRQFLLFVTTLVLGVIVYIRLAIGCESPLLLVGAARADPSHPLVDFSSLPALPSPTPTNPAIEPPTCLIPGPLCTAATADTFALSVVVWATVQLGWTLILLGAQLWQICRQMTTLEVSNVGRYGYMGGKPGVSVGGQMGAVARGKAALEASLALGEEGAEDGEGEGEHVHGNGCEHRRRSLTTAGGGGAGSKAVGKAGFLLKILGIDRFTRGKAAEGLAHAGEVPNPFDLGVWANCVDFWSRGRELGVDYQRLWEVPEGGFARSVRERKRREKDGRLDEEGDAGWRGGAGKGKGRAKGYERLAMGDGERSASAEERERVALEQV